MRLAEVINEAQVQQQKVEERQFGQHLLTHGLPAGNDLGARLALREMFPRVTDAAFERLLSSGGKHGA